MSHQMEENQKIDTFALTKDITYRYLKQVVPYETVVEGINQQNKQIYELQEKYLQMKNAIGKLEYDETGEQQLIKLRNQQRILQRKMYAEEALVAKQPQYKKNFLTKEKDLQSENQLMREIIQFESNGTINIFMHLEEGILSQLSGDCRKKKNDEGLDNIKLWKGMYHEAKKKINQNKN